MTETERIDLQAQYCVKIIQEMSTEERISFAYNVLMDSYYAGYDDEAFLAEVQEHMPDLLIIDVKESKCN